MREKQNRTSLHGVLLEAYGKGLLITGVSGIGKTTAALDLISDDHFWVADDLALVCRNRNGKLTACGHSKIRNLLHTDKTGIIAVRKLLAAKKVKKSTVLAAIIEAQRTENVRSSMVAGKKIILGLEVPIISLRIPSSGYLNKNLLKKAVKKIIEMDKPRI